MRRAVLATFVLLVLSGCAGEPKAPSALPPTDRAIPPLPEGTPTGSIRGIVVSDEAQPLAGAQIALAPAGQTTVAGAGGEFLFSDVPVGDQTIYAEKLGFSQKAQRVQVAQDEEAHVTITLDAIAVPEPRMELYIGTGFFSCAIGSIVFSTFDCTVNLTGTARTSFRLNFSTEKLDGILHETVWQSSSTFSAQWLGQFHYVGGKQVSFSQGPSGMRVIQEGPFSGKRYDGFESYLPVAAPAQPVALALEQKFQLYASAFYEQPLDEQYSAIPPPT